VWKKTWMNIFHGHFTVKKIKYTKIVHDQVFKYETWKNVCVIILEIKRFLYKVLSKVLSYVSSHKSQSLVKTGISRIKRTI